MTGSLQIKNDKYYIIVNLKENGKRKQKWIATGLDVKGNKRKAEQLLRETLLECERAPARPVKAREQHLVCGLHPGMAESRGAQSGFCDLSGL